MRLARQINLAFVASLLLVVTLAGVMSYASVARGFRRHVQRLEELRLQPALRRLGRVYAAEGGWDKLASEPRRLGRLLRRDEDERRPERGADRGEERGRERGQERGRDRVDERGRERVDEHGRERVDEHGRERGDEGGEERGRDRGDAQGRDRGEERGRDRGRGGRRDVDPLELPPRVSLYDASGTRFLGKGGPGPETSRLPIVVDGVVVGYLGLRPIEGLEDELDVGYLQAVRDDMVIIAVAALVLGLAAGGALSWRIVRPLGALASGARRLIAGDYGARIGLTSDDELGQLSRDFDALAGSLDESARARRRWVADTSHELRTPVTVLRAELEAMIDGVRPVDARAVQSLHAEVLRLGALVDALGELARSDRGELQLTPVDLDVLEVVRGAVEAFRGRLAGRGIEVTLEGAGDEGARAWADEARLRQVLTNLLENVARYVDDGGRLEVVVERVGMDDVSMNCVHGVRVSFDDTGPGVPDEALGRLFDRLYRVESSRSRHEGGSGLGLSIARRLVEAHGGTMRAMRSALGGLRVEFEIPVRRGAGGGGQAAAQGGHEAVRGGGEA